MKLASKSLRLFMALEFAWFALPALTPAQHYKQTNLVSDIMGMAPTQDPNLVNPWGLARSSGSPWWVANNNSGTSTLYDGSGNIIPINGNGIVTISPPKGSNAASTPTGVVFNGSATDFVLPNGQGAAFIFVTEDGTISGWNGGPSAVLVVDNSDNGSPQGAVYKGATTADIKGQRFLYVANFRNGKVEVYDTNFNRRHLGPDAFDDDSIPRGFAPFNVQNIGGSLLVTYAQQDSAKHDPIGGNGLGFVDIFTPSGRFITRLEHGDWFNAPWGVVWTPRDFGDSAIPFWWEISAAVGLQPSTASPASSLAF